MYSSGWEPPVRKVKFEVTSSSANMGTAGDSTWGRREPYTRTKQEQSCPVPSCPTVASCRSGSRGLPPNACLRIEPALAAGPFAVVADRQNMQVLTTLSAAACGGGLQAGQPLRDAQAMCPDLVTRPANPQREARRS